MELTPGRYFSTEKVPHYEYFHDGVEEHLSNPHGIADVEQKLSPQQDEELIERISHVGGFIVAFNVRLELGSCYFGGLI